MNRNQCFLSQAEGFIYLILFVIHGCHTSPDGRADLLCLLYKILYNFNVMKEVEAKQRNSTSALSVLT